MRKILNNNINISMKEHEFNVRVRYSETDQMGVVYHGNYAQYFEMGRVEWLRNLGISINGWKKVVLCFQWFLNIN
jgi:acyl-CoA thioesterase FadM